VSNEAGNPSSNAASRPDPQGEPTAGSAEGAAMPDTRLRRRLSVCAMVLTASGTVTLALVMASVWRGYIPLELCYFPSVLGSLLLVWVGPRAVIRIIASLGLAYLLFGAGWLFYPPLLPLGTYGAHHSGGTFQFITVFIIPAGSLLSLGAAIASMGAWRKPATSDRLGPSIQTGSAGAAQDTTLRCRNCGCNLTELAERRCSECGQEFDRGESVRCSVTPRFDWCRTLLLLGWSPLLLLVAPLLLLPSRLAHIRAMATRDGGSVFLTRTYLLFATYAVLGAAGMMALAFLPNIAILTAKSLSARTARRGKPFTVSEDWPSLLATLLVFLGLELWLCIIALFVAAAVFWMGLTD
jgi:hypothetical protein